MVGPQPVKADGHFTDGDEMPNPSLRSALRYGIAPISVALATAIRLALDPLLGDRFPFLAFIVAIGVTAWYGGLGPSLLAVALSWLAADHFLLQPRGPGPIFSDRSQVIFPFFAAGLIVTLLSGAVRDARRRARASAAEARRALEAQQAQREWHRITLASIGDAVITTDPRGRVTSLNPAAERLTGSGGHEAAGRPLTEVLRTVEGAIDGTAHLPVAGVVRGEAVPSGHPTVLIDGGGAARSVEHNAAPIKDDRGEVTGVVIVLRDITERRQAEQALRASEARFRHLADTMPQIVWTAGPDGSVDYFNARWDEYTGMTPEASLGEGWRAAVHPDDLGRFSSVRDRGIGEGEVFEAEVRLRRRDGADRWHLVRSVPVPDEAGRSARRFGAATDIDDRRRAEEALRESERQYRAVYDQAAVGIAEVDLTGRFLRANDRYCEIVGYPQEALLGLRFRDITHPDDPPGHREKFARIAEGPSSYTIEKRFVRKDGRVVWARTAVSLIRDGEGRPARVVAVVEDITERVRAEEALRASEERFARFMQHLPGLAWIKDSQGRYVYANDAAVRAFRHPAHRPLRQDRRGGLPCRRRPPGSGRTTGGRSASGAGVQVIETLEHEDGVVHHSLVSKFPIPGPDGGVALVGGMAIDITDRMRAEEALVEADRRKDEFLAMLAHELRNPLAPIRNALHLLKHPGGRRPATSRPERAMVERQVAHLARLVDDLLDVSRISRGRIELRKEAAGTGRGRCGRRSRRAGRRSRSGATRLTVSLPAEPIRLEADPTRLEQVVWNLLNNAAKYTEPGGQIRLSAEREGAEVVLRVRDTGIGIAPEMLPQVFEMFVQVDRRSERTQGGLGIGLTLVKTLVEMHGGTVEAHSEGPGTGSEFVVRLPVLPAAAERPVEPRRDGPVRAEAVPAPPPHPGGGRQRGRRHEPGHAAARLRARRCGSPTTAPPPWRSPGRSAPRWCSWTSACRGWTATRWPGGCGVGPSSRRRCSWR